MPMQRKKATLTASCRACGPQHFSSNCEELGHHQPDGTVTFKAKQFSPAFQQMSHPLTALLKEKNPIYIKRV
ncbi:unnamed protein product [Ceratitis capitata]|uniref:(Mediterranean fruit fly) hypothetical protein n=1 Tax=Ceratitis capitata TaxID=7213 RepID=A0A811UGK3_CERCA|nr:unnamed protein product [Ceratitis capitata]